MFCICRKSGEGNVLVGPRPGEAMIDVGWVAGTANKKIHQQMGQCICFEDAMNIQESTPVTVCPTQGDQKPMGAHSKNC